MSKWGKRRLGAEPEAQSDRSVRASGTRLGRFEIRDLLGIGGTGVVYAARDAEADRDVALKELTPAQVHGSASLTSFKKQFSALSELDHPNLVRLYELEAGTESTFFTMEAVRGSDPLEYIRTGIIEDAVWPTKQRVRRAQESPLFTTSQYARLRETLVQVSNGILALHRSGMVHCDVKPSNVLVTAEGRAVLLDFGLVQAASARNDQREVEAVGTAAYMAPEHATGHRVGPEADWYSLGVFLYEAVTGRWPFQGPPILSLMRKQRDEAPSLRERVSDAPPDLTRLCRALLAPKPGDRPSGEEIVRVLGGRSAGVLEPDDSTTEIPFIGRHAQIGHLEQALGESRGSRPVAVILEGPAGIGKTALMGRFLDRVNNERADVVVFRGRCHEREHVAYKAFDGILESVTDFLKRKDPLEVSKLLPEDTPLLARLFPMLRRIPTVARMPGEHLSGVDPRSLRSRAFVALGILMSNICRRWPLLVFVDDLQWADADSLALLEHMLGPSAESGFLFVATLRTDDAGAVPPRVRDALDGVSQVRDLAIPPLDTEEAMHLAHVLYKRVRQKHASARLAQRVADLSGGNPLFVDELVRRVTTLGAEGPLRLDGALWLRIKELDAITRQLLEVVAVGAFPMRLDTAAAAAGLENENWGKCAAELRLANLARTTGSRADDVIEPFHDRVRDAVLRRMDHSHREYLHRRIADELHAEGGAAKDPHLILQHLEAAGDHRRAAEVALDAAQRAREALAFDRAAQLYRTILRFGEAEGSIDTQLALARALGHAGRVQEAAEVYEELASPAPRALRVDCQRRAAVHRIQSGDTTKGFALLDAITDTAGGKGLFREAGERLAFRRSRHAPRQTRDESDIAPGGLRRLDSLLLAVSSSLFVDGARARRALDLALPMAHRLAEPRRLSRASGMEAMYVAACEGARPRQSTRMISELARYAEIADDDFTHKWSQGVRGVSHFFAGRFREALQWLDAGIGAFARTDDYPLVELPFQFVRVSCLELLGDLSLARGERQAEMKKAERWGDTHSWTLMALAGDAIHGGDSVSAEPRNATSVTLSLTEWLTWRSHLLACLRNGTESLRANTEDLFRSFRRSPISRVQVLRAEATWLRGRLALTMSGGALSRAEAGRIVHGAVRALAREKNGYARLWSHLLRAGALTKEGAREGAREQLRGALISAQDFHSELFAAVAKHRLGALSGGGDGERLVAEADEYFRREEVAEPERILDSYAPGAWPASSR